MLVTAGFSAGGCSKESLDNALEAAKKKGGELTERASTEIAASAESVLPESGHVRFEFADGSHPISRVEATSAEAEIIVVGSGRPNVLQIRNQTYSPDSTSMPRVIITAATDQTSPANLTGGQLKAQVYLQASAAQAAIPMPGHTAQLTVARYDSEAGIIAGTLSLFRLVDAGGNELLVRGGEWLAVLK